MKLILPLFVLALLVITKLQNAEVIHNKNILSSLDWKDLFGRMIQGSQKELSNSMIRTFLQKNISMVEECLSSKLINICSDDFDEKGKDNYPPDACNGPPHYVQTFYDHTKDCIQMFYSKGVPKSFNKQCFQERNVAHVDIIKQVDDVACLTNLSTTEKKIMYEIKACSVGDTVLRKCIHPMAHYKQLFIIITNDTKIITDELNLVLSTPRDKMLAVTCKGSDATAESIKSGMCSGDSYYCELFKKCSSLKDCSCEENKETSRQFNVIIEESQHPVSRVVRKWFKVGYEGYLSTKQNSMACLNCSPVCVGNVLMFKSMRPIPRMIKINTPSSPIYKTIDPNNPNVTFPFESLEGENVRITLWRYDSNDQDEIQVKCPSPNKCDFLTCKMCPETLALPSCVSDNESVLMGFITFILICGGVLLTYVAYKLAICFSFFVIMLRNGYQTFTFKNMKNLLKRNTKTRYVDMELKNSKLRADRGKYSYRPKFNFLSIILIMTLMESGESSFTDSKDVKDMVYGLAQIEVRTAFLILIALALVYYAIKIIIIIANFLTPIVYYLFCLIFSFINVLRRRRINSKNIVVLLFILSILDLSTSCSRYSSLSAMTNECVKKPDGRMLCTIKNSLRVTLSPIGQKTCIMIKDPSGVTSASMEIEIKSISYVCEPQFLYYTSEVKAKTDQFKACGGSNDCGSEDCTGKESDFTKTRTQFTHSSKHKGWQTCTAVPGCWANGCFTCTSACAWSYSYLENEQNIVYKVSNCKEWKLAIMGIIELKGFEDSGKQINFRLDPTKPYDFGDFSMSLISVTSPMTSVTNLCIIEQVGNENQITAVHSCNGQNELILGSIGELQCPSLESAKYSSPDCSIKESVITTIPQTYGISTISNPIQLSKMIKHSILPLHIGSFLLERVDNFIHAETSFQSLLEFQLDAEDLQFTSTHTDSVCDIEFISLKGCFSCLRGAELIVKAHSVPSGSIAVLECESLSLSVVLNLKPESKLIRTQVDIKVQKVDANCFLKCQQSSSQIRVRGDLEFIPPYKDDRQIVPNVYLKPSGIDWNNFLSLPFFSTIKNVLIAIFASMIVVFVFVACLKCYSIFRFICKPFIKAPKTYQKLKRDLEE